MTAPTPPATQTNYRVRLDAFEGPLDLLLFLIRRAEVDVTDIPIAAITDQYMAQLEQIERIDIELAGEFLVMAATLMEIKSRMINPPEATDAPDREGEEGEEKLDPRAELVRQLLDYKKYRDAADELDHRRLEWEQRAPVVAGADAQSIREAAEELGEIDMEDLGLSDLIEAFQEIVASVNFDRLGEHEVLSDDTPIELHAEDLLDQLKRDAGAHDHPPRLSLRRVLTGRSRAEMIGLFLAMLTLIRDQRVGVRQPEAGGDIELELRPDADADAPPIADDFA
ncbi:MAG: segregation and condensation protein A [Phycisphaerales bacterium JB059]